MNREQIIQMARDAGFVEYELDDGTTNAFDIRYEAFAKLVAEHERERIKQANAPDIERVNSYIKVLEDDVKQAQQAEPCGLECDCTDVCKQDNYKALWQQMCERCDALDKQLAQRTWVGLTDAEQQELYDAWVQLNDGWGSFYALIEAKLKEKNT